MKIASLINSKDVNMETSNIIKAQDNSNKSAFLDLLPIEDGELPLIWHIFAYSKVLYIVVCCSRLIHVGLE